MPSQSERQSEPFYASDLDGDALEMELAESHASKPYGALLAVACGHSGRLGAMYLDRPQAERLRDYLNEALA